MGFNTTLIVLNDALHLIKEDKEFGRKVYDATLMVDQSLDNKGVDISSGNHCNAATVIESHHADGYRLIMVGGNTAWVLGYAGTWPQSPNKDLRVMLNNVAKNYGLSVVKARKPKKG